MGLWDAEEKRASASREAICSHAHMFTRKHTRELIRGTSSSCFWFTQTRTDKKEPQTPSAPLLDLEYSTAVLNGEYNSPCYNPD